MIDPPRWLGIAILALLLSIAAIGMVSVFFMGC